MKKIILFVICFILATIADAQVTVSGSTGANATYSRLALAFTAINGATQTGNNIVITITANTTESTTATLNAGAWTTLTIYPTTTGLTISGNLSAPLIDLNGADYVTIDGRVNANGSTKSLSITNTNTGSGATTSTIRFINSAENNTVKYCTIKGSETNTSGGIIFFSTAAAGNGNDGNSVNNNNITSDAAGRPINAIYSAGSGGYENSENTISNNNIYDFLNKGAISAGINLGISNTNWTISDNNLYEVASFIPTASVAYNAIKINNASGTGFTVSGNFIGGSSASCGGSVWTKTAAFDNVFYAINLNVGATPASSVQNNTIQNITWSNSAAASWTGIQVAVGAVNIGTITGNTIGASTGTGSITVTAGATGTNVYGINAAGSGTVNCQNNIIGAITVANANSSFACNFYGINRSNTGNNIFSNNTIGSTSQANSIQASSASTSNAQSVFGIYNTTGGNLTISNNTIANLTNSTTNAIADSLGVVDGIKSTSGIITITGNTIHNLTNANANSSSIQNSSVCGITLTSTNALNTITGNTINNLSNSNNTFAGSVIGLYFGSTGMYTSISHTVTGNFIHSLSATGSSSTGASLYGIKINTGQTTYANNIISLDENTATTIYGIYETGTSSNNNNIFFNTVYIGGTPTTSTANSYAFYSATSTNTRNFTNNIFENARSNNGATGKHYAAYFNYGVNTFLTLDFNDYYAPGTGGVLGYYNGTDIATLPLITGLDAKSLTINPAFANAGGTTASNYIPSSNKLEGTTISSIATDYALVNRAATPTMGAYDVALNLNIDVYKSGVFQSSYSTLKGAFDKINSGAHTGDLEIRIKANTVETASAILYQSGYTLAGGTSNFSSVNIYPIVTGISITGSFDAALIDLNGADNVIIDGRVNHTGIKNFTFSNFSVSTYAAAIRFANSAENNTVKYCNINSSCNSPGVGVVYFASSASGNGNDNNLMEYCDISNAGGNRPLNVIFSSGGNGHDNSGNIIRNNNIFDFFNASASSSGINISYNSTDWTISNNSFYETTTFAPIGAYSYNVIRINTGNNIINNNYIGGTQSLCAGSAWTIRANVTLYFCGFFVNGGTGVNSCLVENNTLQNMNVTSVEDNPWDGIFLNAGDATISGNTIGSPTGNNSIIITTPLPAATATLNGGAINNTIVIVGGGSGYTTPPLVTFSAPPSGGTAPTATAVISGGAVSSINVTYNGSGYLTAPSVIFDGQSNNYSTSHGMINNSTGTVIITNNNWGSITTVGSNTYSHGFETVYNRGATGTTTLSNNLIGSLTTPNSIYVSSPANLALQKEDVYGLYNASSGNVIMTGNTIANVTNAYNGTNGSTKTRSIATIAGSSTIQGNTIRDISCASGQTGTLASASVIGIAIVSAIDGTTQTVNGNTIYNLSNTNTTAPAVIYGIYYGGPTSGINTVSGNFIHSISFSSSNTGCDMEGILFYNGLTTCANNIINLGVGITTGYKINGIWDESSATNNNNIYFNTIYIGGAVSSGTTSSTAALWNKNNTSTRNYRNNILMNARTGGSTGKHYAIRIEGMANVTLDYNDYFSASGSLGRIGLLDKADLTAWKSGTSQDLNSISINPGFVSAGGTSALNYYTSAVLPGVSGIGITTDYAGLTRGVTPKMGALERNNFTWVGTTNDNFAVATNWLENEAPTGGENIFFDANPVRNCVLYQNQIVGNITNAQSTYKFVVNGKQLTVKGNLTFTNSAQIDATASSSAVIFAGSSAQSIPSGVFVSNTVDTLTINNSLGLTLNGNLTIAKKLMLANGTFSIGANTLTINGIIAATSGTLTGGSSTNIIISGSGTSTTLPAVSLNNLTINRTNGIIMGGAVSVGGTLTLTNGTLTLGANTLTISGNSPTRTNGSIDASNASATLSFGNTSAITLPVSIFNGSVNNLAINGIGGITASSDFSLNGILNLQSANPSANKGSLDMGTNILNMGASATTIGVGDVTGIVKRSSFVASTSYSFGNQFTTMSIASGVMPTDISFKISIGSAPSWKTTTIKRIYDIKRSGGDPATLVTLTLHYLDSELNNNTESDIVVWDRHVLVDVTEEHGKANGNTTDNWVSISNRKVTYFDDIWDNHFWTLAKSEAPDFTWQGTPSSDWNDPNNWSGGNIPVSTSDVVIPDAATTLHDPILPANTSINTLTINTGGILEGGTGTILNIMGSAGAWLNLGTFNPGTSTVIFNHANATIADPTNFYNVTIATGAGLTPETGNIMRIAGTLTNNGTLRAALLPNTIEFNGDDQTIVNPNGLTPGYYNLILSGSGTKTLPATALSVTGDFSTSGTATATAGNSISIAGNFTIETGTTFNTNTFNHSIGGNFENNGSFTTSSGNTITMNGTSIQTISGTTTTIFNNLTINNSYNVNLLMSENVTNTLTLTIGNLNVGETTLGINGTIVKTSGFLDVGSLSSLIIGGTSALTIPDNLFTTAPSLNNLTINRSGGVILGNQNMTINGLLDLSSGTFSVAANTLTIAGSSPTRTSGYVDASNAGATIAFINTTAITLPVSFFTGAVNNLTVNSTGGITVSSDFTLNGILNLQSTNPSATKGGLDMWDSSAMKTLTMGANATTTGTGDVTGIIKRTAFNANVAYSFGNKFTTITFASGGTYPSQIQTKIVIGTAPTWKASAINRYYDFVQTGGSNCIATIATHYLDSELNQNYENELVQWTNGTPGPPLGLYEWGKSNMNLTDNWIAIANVNIGYFPTTFGQLENTLSTSELPSYTWNGSQSSLWTTLENWTPTGTPSLTSDVIIPDASTTLHSPYLPDATEIKSVTIETSGILNSNLNAQLTINGGNGAWSNSGGTFNPTASNVIFTNAVATISGITNFYDVTINGSGVLSMANQSIMKISGTMTNNGIWNTLAGGIASVEYNGGAQVVINPTGGYDNLILSGSGSKTTTGVTINGILSMEGTATTTGTAPTYGTGATLQYKGLAAQTTGIELSSSFGGSGGIIIDNTNGVTLGNSSATTNSGGLHIKNGALTINPLINLTVDGTTILENAQCLIIKSNASHTGSFIDNGFSGSGTAKIERWVSDNGSQRYEYISSPVSSASSSIFTSDIHGLWYVDETQNNWISILNSAPQNMTVFKGYQRSYQTIAAGGAGNGDANTNYDFIGSLNTNALSIPVTFTAGAPGSNHGWNLVGNPYPCAINWDASSGWTKTNINNAIYFRKNGNTYDYVDGVGTASGFIPPMQSFWVRATADGTLGCNNLVRTHNTTPIYKATQDNSLEIIATNNSNGLTDATFIRFKDYATDNFDGQYDAYKMFAQDSTYPQVYTITGTDDISINTLSTLSGERTVLLGFKTTISGQFTFKAEMVSSFTDNGNTVYLEDLQTGIYQNLSLINTYQFNSGVTTGLNRFIVHFNPNITNINESSENNIQIFANKNDIHIDALNLLNGDLSVYDLLGQLVFTKYLSGVKSTIVNLKDQSDVYIVKYTTSDETITKRIFISH